MTFRLGVFWIYQGKVLSEALPWEEVEAEGGVRDLDRSHYDVWNETFKDSVGKEYEEVLRGRVLMDEAGTIFMISSREFKGSISLQKLVIEAFHLENVQFLSVSVDSHYEIPPPDVDLDDL